MAARRPAERVESSRRTGMARRCRPEPCEGQAQLLVQRHLGRGRAEQLTRIHDVVPLYERFGRSHNKKNWFFSARLVLVLRDAGELKRFKNMLGLPTHRELSIY